MANFLGIPYPITKTPLGFMYSQGGVNQIKADLLQLLLTNPGERVMEPNFGTPLRELLFEPNDATLQVKARNVIATAIATWEPRIAVSSIEVSSQVDQNTLSPYDDKTEIEHILSIKILFVDPQNITQIQDLTLEVPLTGG